MKYFYLQCKRLLRLLPLVTLISVVLILAFSAVFSKFAGFMDEKQTSRFKIGVVGEAGSNFFNMGLSAVQTLDDSRFSIEMVMFENDDIAAEKLRNGEVSAYVSVPEGFTRAIEYGRILPIKYCTTESYIDISAIMKNEITQVISTYLKESQRGVFAVSDLLYENGYEDISEKKMNDLSVEYVDFILDRSKMYKTEISGFPFGLSFVQYIALGLTVTFIFVFAIPFACLFAKRDRAFIKILRSSGMGAPSQVFAESSAFVCAYISVFLSLAAAAFLALSFYPDLNLSPGIDPKGVMPRVLPVAILACVFAFFIFELSDNIISAVTGYFFITFALCYISGCIYPAYALPETLQRIAEFTPTGVARVYLSNGAIGENTLPSFLMLLLYVFVFFALAVLIRRRKLCGKEA
ncbi:MAG: ABC transporter permease [Clostridia bacterium]|nr:ABC transporter permease [Clostridia bacterium]MBR4910009.1 ABC transporter permease [Clostridia bacterium]